MNPTIWPFILEIKNHLLSKVNFKQPLKLNSFGVFIWHGHRECQSFEIENKQLISLIISIYWPQQWILILQKTWFLISK